ncbi:hypothetical protein J5500_02515 [Candidatus Saccharibacteria bacterium]|nr:hypothetical protein [Candidatus Saccharibacteria bacterium]
MSEKKKESNKQFKIAAIIIGAIAVVIAIVAVIVFGIGSSRHERNGGIVSFSYSHGSGMGGYVDYTLKKQDNLALYSAKCMGCMNNFDVNKTIDSSYLGKIADIVKKYEMGKWDGFNESDDGILDGSGFTLKIEYDDERKIEAHGYMKYPSNYREATEELTNLLDEIRKEE